MRCPHCNKELPEETDSSSLAGNIGTALLVGGALVAGPCLLLTAAGFSASGIVAGSYAAASQAAIGNVAAGSTFAACQSLGASGFFSAWGTAGVVTAAGGGVVKASADAEKSCPYCHQKLGTSRQS
eukprot:m.293350 g.293350  ORF g.293350 m.293350 type:complete len:126 (-) comp20682_c0_seq1:236-613(-)